MTKNKDAPQTARMDAVSNTTKSEDTQHRATPEVNLPAY